MLGRVPDPSRGHVRHLAVVQATRHNVPGESKITTWAVLRFVPNGLGPEADAVMDQSHHGQQIQNFDLRDQGNVMRGITPA